jgi:type I restriction enzyme S subunit
MTTKKKKAANVPNLRFPGFERVWIQRNLGEICSMQAGKFISASEIRQSSQTGLFPCYGGNGLRGYVNSFNQAGVYPLIGRQGALCGNVMLAEGKFHATEHAVVVKSNEDVDTSWLYYLLIRLNLNQYATGAAQPGLSVQNLEQVELRMPKSEKEQKKISSFLAMIDERIQTQNKIIEQLESLIKGMRDKLFCQKIRFPQFKEQWLQYRVSDFLTFFSTNSLSWEQLTYQQGTINNLHYGLIHQHESPVIDIDNFVLPSIKTEFVTGNYEYCQDGDIAFADASEDVEDVAKAIEFVNCKDRKIICGLHTIHGRDKLSITISGFKGYAFASSTFRRQIRQLAQGTKVFSISSKTFNECFVGIPTKNEQQEITNFLAALYKKLEVEKSCLSKYVIQKKHLLLNMFI